MKEPVCTRSPPAPKKTNLQILQLPYFVSKNLPFQIGTLKRFASENPEAEDLFG